MKVAIIAPFGSTGGVQSYSRSLSKHLRKHKIKVLQIDTQIKINKIFKGILQPFVISIKLCKNKDKYDIISVQAASYWGFVPAIVSVIANKFVKKKLICTYHGGEVKDFIRKHPTTFKFVLKNCDDFIAVSDFIKKSIVKRFPEYSKKITVIENGYESNVFYPSRKKIKTPRNKKIILNVGNLDKVKGHKYLINAVKELDVICYIVGEGTERKNLEKQIKDNNVKNVFLLGRKSHNELPRWINSTNLFVLPSLKESFGIVQLEAMACGIPVVATDVGINKQIIYKNGIIVRPASSKDLAKAIQKALKKKWDKKIISNYAKKYSWNNVIKDVIVTYRQN